jgi:hypothetical protein
LRESRRRFATPRVGEYVVEGRQRRAPDQGKCILDVPIRLAAIRGSVLGVLTVILWWLFVKNVSSASAFSMSVGLWARMIGALQYRAERWLSKTISG